MPLDDGEVADAAPGVHLPDETIPDVRHELGAPLVLPLLEQHCPRHVEAVEERAADLHVARVEPSHVCVHDVLGERDGRPLHLEVLAADLRLDHRQRLSQGVPRAMRRGVRPQQIHQVVTRELLPRFGREANQQREVLTGAEADVLPSLGDQEGSTEAGEMQVRRHDGSQRFGLVLLGAQINVLSTR